MRARVFLFSISSLLFVLTSCKGKSTPAKGVAPAVERKNPVRVRAQAGVSLPFQCLASAGNFRRVGAPSRSDSKPPFLSSLWTQGNHRLLLREYGKLGERDAKKIVKEETFLLKSMFVEHRSPYPGLLSQKKGCPESSKPQLYSAGGPGSQWWLTSYRLWANKRLIHGGCLPSMNFYRTAVVFLYCKKAGRFFQFKYFFKATEGGSKNKALLPWIQSIRCK